MSERQKAIWAFRRTHLLNGKVGFITVPESVAKIAIERKFATATYSGRPMDKRDAPFADDATAPVAPAAPLPATAPAEDLGTRDDSPELPPPPAKRKPGRPRKNPAP